MEFYVEKMKSTKQVVEEPSSTDMDTSVALQILIKTAYMDFCLQYRTQLFSRAQLQRMTWPLHNIDFVHNFGVVFFNVCFESLHKDPSTAKSKPPGRS